MKIKWSLKSTSLPESHCLPPCVHQLVKGVTILHKSCQVCKEGVWPGQLLARCQLCSLEVHESCRHLVQNIQPKNLLDFVSSAGVGVPVVLVNLVAQIESRGLHMQGLYRVPGNNLHIKSLVARTLTGANIAQDINGADIHVLCGVVKEFFCSLKTPLIAASKLDMADDVMGLVSSLDIPNRETLAFLILHLQKVVSSPHTKMTAGSLATVVAMSVFGIMKDQHGRLEELLLDSRKKKCIVEEMIKMAPVAWKMILARK